MSTYDDTAQRYVAYDGAGIQPPPDDDSAEGVRLQREASDLKREIARLKIELIRMRASTR